jgi:hypothetical protein
VQTVLSVVLAIEGADAAANRVFYMSLGECYSAVGSVEARLPLPVPFV